MSHLLTRVNVASHADVLRLVTRSSPRGTRDKPKNVCVGGYPPREEFGGGAQAHFPNSGWLSNLIPELDCP